MCRLMLQDPTTIPHVAAVHDAIESKDLAQLQDVLATPRQEAVLNAHARGTGSRGVPLVRVIRYWPEGVREHAIRLLAEAKADVNHSHVRNSYTPLTYACFEGYADCVLALLEAGADPNLKRSNKCTRRTPLAVTVCSDHVQ